MTIKLVLYLLFCHYVADFLCQTSWMATNKSKIESPALSTHCIVYGFVMGLMTWNFWFGLTMLALHYPVDFITSRVNEYLWNKKLVRPFFMCVGLDQLIHYIIIFSFYPNVA